MFTILFAQFVSQRIAENSASFESEFLALSDDKGYLQSMKQQITNAEVVRYRERIQAFISRKTKK